MKMALSLVGIAIIDFVFLQLLGHSEHKFCDHDGCKFINATFLSYAVAGFMRSLPLSHTA